MSSVRDVCTNIQHNYVLRRYIEAFRFDEKRNACIIVPKSTLHIAFNLNEGKMKIFEPLHRADASEIKLVKPLRYVVHGGETTELSIEREPELIIPWYRIVVFLEDDKEIKLVMMRRKE